MIGSQELLVLLGLGIFVFGAKRLPEISRSLGQALNEFKRAVSGSAPDATPPSASTPRDSPPAKSGTAATAMDDKPQNP